jgi:titin
MSDVAIDMMRPFVFDYWGVNNRSAKTGTTKVYTNLPATPTGVAFNGLGLTWTDPTPASAAATFAPDPKNEIGFIVTAVETYGSNTSTKTYTLPANQTVWIDKDMVAGRNYTFTVAGYNALGTGVASTPINVAYNGATLAPVLTVAGPTTNSVDLIWGNTSLQAMTYDVMYGTTNPPTQKFTTVTSSGALDLANLVVVSGLTPNTTYYFQVVAKGTTNQLSNVITQPTNSLGASGLTATATGSTTASVSWVMGAGGGTPQLTISPAGGRVTMLPAVGGLINGATVTGLAANTSYTITLTVTGINGLVASTAVTTLTTNVGPATALATSAITTNSATIAWNNPTGAVSQSVTISPSTVAGVGAAVATLSGTNTSAALTNLAPNTLYTVTVKEVGINGLTTNASTTFTTTPGVVSNIKFAITNGAGTITWTLPTGGGNVKVTATPAATITTSAAADNVTATVSGLVSGTTYTFNFVITGGAGAARPGATVTQTFYAANAPTAVTATLSAANQAVLKFTTTAALTKFGANYATSAAGPWLPLTATTTIAGGVTGTMTVTAPTNFVSGTTYYFQVVALNASNVAGTPSASATIAMTTPSAVTGLTATQGATGSRAISLAWTKASNNAATLTIFRRVGTTTGTFTQVAQIAGNATTYTDTGLTAGTTYQYYVVAGSVAGNSALSSYASAAAR